MKAKRAKQYRKLMHQYGLHFGFREPYQVLIDAGMIKDAARFKMQLGSMLENTLHGQIKPMITQCCIRHLYDIETSTSQERAEKDSWIEAAKAAERRRCGHHELEEPLSTLECLESVVDPKDSGRNRHRYVVASQDQGVRRRMREIAGVPLVYINRSVMILEPMALATEDVRSKEEKLKMRSGLKSRRAAAGVKRKRDDDGDEMDAEVGLGTQREGEPKKRKIKGPKEPNPLSVMKPKKMKAPQLLTIGGERRVTIRKAMQPDSLQEERSARLIQNDDSQNNDTTDGAKKRKRKRKPKEAAEHASAAASDEIDG